MWGFLGSKTFPCCIFGAIADSQESLGSQLSFWEISGLLREVRKWEAWNGERGINWIGKHELNSLSYHFGWGLYRVRNLLKTIIWKKWSCSDFCFISFSTDLILLPIRSVSAVSGLMRAPSFLLFGQPSETSPRERGFFSPRDSQGIWGAEKYRVQRSSNYLWELMRGNELICDTCKLETQLQGAGRGLGHPAACNTDVLIWEEVSCWLWRAWLCTEPCFWFKWDSFEKESKSW